MGVAETGHDLIPEPIISAEEIGDRVASLAVEIGSDYRNRDLHIVVVLHGALIFAADLVRGLGPIVTLDTILVRSYPTGSESTGQPQLVRTPDKALVGRDVLIVEDIVDTGLTLQFVRSRLQAENPRSLRCVSLLDKPARRQVQISADYVGFEIEDRFVVGYGLDVDGRYRNLPYVGCLPSL